MGGFLSTTIGANTLSGYLIAAVIFVVLFFALKAVWYIIRRVLKAIAAKLAEDVADMVSRILPRKAWPLFLLISASVAAGFLQIPALGTTVLGYALMAVIVVYVILSLHRVVDFAIRRFLIKPKSPEERDVSAPIANLIGIIAKLALWIIAFIFVLSNLGFDILTLVTGLGVGGLVIAFGLQNVLQDLFASFAIQIDRPFVPGDFIIIGNDLGVVKNIGIKSTRIQHLGGQELVVSNRELTDIRINNYKLMERRRVVFGFGVTYQTTPDKLRIIPGIVKDIIGQIEVAEMDRVHFKEFGDFSLNFEVVYYVDGPDYNIYMDTQQQINLALAERLEREGVEFAYPTQTLFLEKQPEEETNKNN